ncbi:MAG TPA: response regulator [Nitrospirota bacterium]|nr:response regulator [Nitrospirota bacterium]
MSNGKTILLIDDEPEVLEVLADILSTAGYTVVPRGNAESSLKAIKGGTKIDLVITDLVMPGMDGSALAEVIRKTLPDVPVILLTGHGSVESYIKTRSSGVFEYINKPVQSRELCRIVQAAIGGPSSPIPQ